jgi:hypothetical protein
MPICDVWAFDRRNWTFYPISVASDGNFGDADSGQPALSANGRFVVFRTNASNLLPPGAAPGQLVVVDRDADGNGVYDEPGTRTIELVSAADGSTVPGNDASDSAEISDDGRYVAFRSMASNLVPLDLNGGWDVFERDRVTSETRLLTRRPTGQPSPVPVDRAEISMSGDGRFVAFASPDRFLTAGFPDDNDPFEDVFVYDHDTQILTRIVLADGVADGFDVDSPMLTADGRYVAVHALSQNTAVPWGGLARSIFVVDRMTGASTKVSVLSDGSDLNSHADVPVISADGTVVLFTSKASNVAQGLDDQFDKIFAVVHFDVQPAEVIVPGRGGSGTFTVTTQLHTQWSAQWDWSQSWLTVETPPFGNVGNGSITFRATQPNPDPVRRSMAITIGSRPVTFTQNAGLSISSLTPTAGPVGGGTVVTVHGTGFEPGMQVVMLGGVTPAEFVDDTTIRFTTLPWQTAGLTYVGAFTDNQFAWMDNAFRYTDQTPPIVMPFIQGALGNNGWYIGNVTVDWGSWDPESDVTSRVGCVETIITTDTVGTTVTCSATSEGGTTTQSVTIKRDTTPPSVVITQPASGRIYTGGTVVPAAFSCTDALSGNDLCAGVVAAGDPIDTSSEGFDRPFYVSTRDQAGNMGGVFVTYDVSLSSCNAIDPPRLWWRMQGETVDVKGGLIATPNNVTSNFVPAITGQGLSLPNRTAGFLQVEPSPRLDFDDVMSIALWVNPTAATEGVLVSHPSQYWLHRLADGSIQWAFTQADGGGVSATVPNAAPQDVWTHLVLTYDHGTVKTYVNGRLVNTTSRTGALRAPEGTTTLAIGGQDLEISPLPFVGAIDEMQLFDRALYNWEAASVYLSGSYGLCVPSATSLAVNMPTAIDFGTSSYSVGVVLMDDNGQGIAGKSVTLSSGVDPARSTITLVTDTNGIASWNAPANFGPPGTYANAFSATFEGDTQYQRTSISRDLIVQRLTPQITWPAPANITYGAALGANQLNASADVAGTFTYDPPAGTVLDAGTQTLSATFHPTDATDYNDATTFASLTVQKAQPAMTITGGAFTYDGQPHAASATASDYLGQPLSPVTITYDASSNPPVNAGSYSAVASYAGDANHLSRSVSATITINKATPAVAWAAPAPITYGTALGSVQLNATASVGGTFSYTPGAGTRLAAGSGITLSATFTPTDSVNYTSLTTTRSIDVLQAPLSIAAVNTSKVFGAPLPAFAAVGSGFANGDSMASLSGTAAFNTAATASSPVGSYAVTPSGLSSPNYTIAFVAGVLTVTQATSAVGVGSSANPSGSNQAVTFTATVSIVAPGAGTPTGTIEFRDGSTRLGTVMLTNGTASLTTNGFSATSHAISAIYSGNGNVAGSAQPLTQSVLTSTQSSTTALSSSSNPATAGTSVTLTATVTAPSGLSGNVAFYDGASLLGTAALSATKAKLVISTLSLGAHAITARYLGNATIPPSISPVFSQTIKPSGTTLRNSTATVVASPSPATLDQPVTFTATVSGNQSTPPTGLVVFFVDGFVVSGPVTLSPSGSASARATITTTALAHGIHDVTVAYLGDGTYKGDIGTTSLTVN